MVEEAKSVVEWFAQHVDSLKDEKTNSIIRKNALRTTYKLAWRLKTLAEHTKKQEAIKRIGEVLGHANPELNKPGLSELNTEEWEELSKAMKHYINRVERGETPFEGQSLAEVEKSFARESAENEAREL
jgi:hypothetical protein